MEKWSSSCGTDKAQPNPPSQIWTEESRSNGVCAQPATVAAEASTVPISFGINSGNGTAVVDGAYLGESGEKVNRISTGDSYSYTSGALVNTGGDAIGITLPTGGVCCGSGGALTDTTAKGSVLSHDNKFYDVFGQPLTSVPEPAATGFGLPGLAALMIRRRRR